MDVRPLEAFAPGIYTHTTRVRFFGMWLETRMAVIQLQGGRLLVYSPTPLDNALAAALSSLGCVAYVLAPNKIHNQALGAYAEFFPTARFFAARGLRQRRPNLRVDVEVFSEVDAGGADWPWAGELDTAVTAGSVFFQEILLFHRSTGTVLVCDLVENPRARTAVGLVASLLRALGVLRAEPMPSPEFALYTHDAAAFAASVSSAVAWPVCRMFLCHGELILGKDAAHAALSSVVNEIICRARRRGPVARALLWLAACFQ